MFVPMVGAEEKLDASEIPMGFPCVFLAAPAHAGLEYVLQSWSGNPIYLDHGPVMELYNSNIQFRPQITVMNGYKWL
jgi:hypothetical protein